MPKRHSSAADETPAGHLHEAQLQQIVGYQLAQATIATNEVFTTQVGEPMGLRRVEYTLLTLIQQNPECTPARLARALDVTAPNITMWIAKLQERGWVLREQHQTDKRSHHVRLSARGARLVAEATQRLIDGERATLTRLSPAERAILIELLHKVACCRPGSA